MYALALAPDVEGGARLPNLVADIAQSIAVIVGTPKGAKIHDPEFGCDLWDAIDRPLGQVPAAVAAVVRAVRRDEPRVSIDQVATDFSGAGAGQVTLTIAYRILATGEAVTSTATVQR